MSARPSVVSLCSGVGGLDLGLEQAGFETRAMAEIDPHARETIRLNLHRFRRPTLPLFEDITCIDPEQMLRRIDLERRELTLLAAGLPCQSYSTAGKRQSIFDPRGQLFFHFMSALDVMEPRFALIENVRGLASAAIKHRPLSQRAARPLSPDEEAGSALRLMLEKFRTHGYQTIHGTVNAADYGVPQTRERFLIIASRDHEISEDKGEPRIFLKRTHSPKRWRTLGEALAPLGGVAHDYVTYSAARAAIYEKVPEGQNWRFLRDVYGEDAAREALGGAFESGGGKVGFYRRLSRSRPAPTLPTSPIQKSTGLCHPVDLRPLSVQEYAALQQFPASFKFAGPTSARYRQIGNAVPVGLGRAIGRALLRVVRDQEPSDKT